MAFCAPDPGGRGWGLAHETTTEAGLCSRSLGKSPGCPLGGAFSRIESSGNYVQERKRPLRDINDLNAGLFSRVRSEKWRETHILRLSRVVLDIPCSRAVTSPDTPLSNCLTALTISVSLCLLFFMMAKLIIIEFEEYTHKWIGLLDDYHYI